MIDLFNTPSKNPEDTKLIDDLLGGENFDLTDEGQVSPLPVTWKMSDHSKQTDLLVFPEPELVKVDHTEHIDFKDLP